MKRKFRFNIPPRIILFLLTGLCIVLIFISFQYSAKLTSLRNLVGTIMTPMQKGVNNVGSWLHSKSELLSDIDNLLEENASLKQQLDSVSQENKLLQQNKYEYDELRKLYALDEKYAGYDKVAARVISRETDNWYSSIIIDKGSDHGVKVDMNVLAGEGLVGLVTEVGRTHSKVRLITDDDSNVSGMFLKTGDTCNIKGNLKLIDDGLIDVEIINKDAEIQEGYDVVTSYISPKFFPGILIGYVENLTVDANNLTMSGNLRPVVDFDTLSMVLIITEVKEYEPLKQ